MIAHILSFAFLFSSLTLLGGSAHASDRECDSDVAEAVETFFQLENFYYPYPKEDGKLVAQSCKVWPNDPTKTITAFVYDSGHPKKKFLLALVDTATGVVVSSYSDWMPEEDAVTRIERGSVQLDTAPYILSKTTRSASSLTLIGRLVLYKVAKAKSYNCSLLKETASVQFLTILCPSTIGAEKRLIVLMKAGHFIRTSQYKY